MPAPFTITTTKSRPNFTFEEYYKLLEEVKQTYGTIDPTVRITPPSVYASDSQAAYGQPTKPELIIKFENLILTDVGPIAREYVGLLRGFLVQKYPNLAPAIQNVSQVDNRIQREFLSIPEMQRYLTLDGYNSYAQYIQAYQDYRAITPKWPLRSTSGQETNNPFIFGRRNANLFEPYVVVNITPNPTQINRQTAQQQQQNQLQQQRTNLTK
jgi:hypothetical protein